MSRTPGRHARPAATTIRGDIQGLRAVAVVLVLLWHAHIPGVPGGFIGVDVFFVISGFLITGLLLAPLRDGRRLSLVEFYSRRVRRLLPAAAVVVTAAMVMTYLLLPRVRWPGTAWDAVYSSLYAINWRLADQATDYLAQGMAPSILQHYWSLSVEEQFYLVWPVVLLVLLPPLRGRDDPVRAGRRLGIALGVIIVGSVAWSVYLARTDPAAGYFVTTTRMWEFALGGAVTVLLPRIRLHPILGAVAGWGGLAAVVLAAALLTGATPYPGYAALLPALGTAVLLGSGATGGGPSALLDTAPLRAVGALSYSLYLWHWPVLVVAEARFGPLSVPWSAAVVAGSALPAWLTYRFIENPIRYAQMWRWRPAPAVGLGALLTAVPVAAALLFGQILFLPTAPPPASDLLVARPGATAGQRLTLSEDIGAGVLAESPRADPDGAPRDAFPVLRPDPLRVREDLPDVYRDGCHQNARDSAAVACRYGEATAPHTMALVGDSHAAQWVPALQVITQARGWRLVSYTKSGCPFADAPVPQATGGRAYESCAQWNRNVLAELAGTGRPDVVIVSNSAYQVLHEGEPMPEAAGRAAFVTGLRARWQALTTAGVPVVVVRDTPHPGRDVAECVTAHVERLTSCAFPRGPALAGAGRAEAEAVRGLDRVSFVDLGDAICPTDPCAAVIGGVIVYRDTNHLTATYARSLAPHLDAALAGLADAR